MQRSRFIEILNVPRSENELSWQLGGGRVRKDTPPVSIRLRPCWTAFLSILRDKRDQRVDLRDKPNKQDQPVSPLFPWVFAW